jgi:hypothetical protein
MRLLSACLLALITLTIAAGCSSGVTETGYEPHRLGMSDGQRKALYAPKYSPEAAQAQSETDQASKNRKPGGFLQ